MPRRTEMFRGQRLSGCLCWLRQLLRRPKPVLWRPSPTVRADPLGCWVWGAIRNCPQGQSCEGTQCVDACNPECDLGTQRCADGGVQVCENFNGCPAWSQVNACPQGTACSGNGECRACSAGETDWQDCGLCGFQVRECVNGVWGEWGFCDEFGICRPGAVEVCGNCGTRTCNQACEWSDCENEGPCEAGATEACGECGVRECGAQCNWGACGIAIITFVTAKSAGGNGAAPMVTGATIVRVNPAMMPRAENLESACLTDAVDFSHD